MHRFPLAWGTAYIVRDATGSALDVDGHASTEATFMTMTRPPTFDTPDFEGTVHGVFETTVQPGWEGTAGLLGAQSWPVEGAQAVRLRGGGAFTASLDGTSATELVLRVHYTPGLTASTSRRSQPDTSSAFASRVSVLTACARSPAPPGRRR